MNCGNIFETWLRVACTKQKYLLFLYEFAQGVFVSCVPEILYYDDKECDFSPRLSVQPRYKRRPTVWLKNRP